jgi:hypothetical protein
VVTTTVLEEEEVTLLEEVTLPADPEDDKVDLWESLSRFAMTEPVSEPQRLGEIDRSLLLGTLMDGRFRILRPIDVTLTKENDDVIAEAHELNEFGFGKNFSEALRDLQRTIVELYLSLTSGQHDLGPDLLHTLDTLKANVSLRP